MGKIKANISPFKKAVELIRLGGQFALQPVRLAGKDDPLWKFEKWLELESLFGFHSTFFFFPAPGPFVHEWDCSYRLSDMVKYGRKKMSVAKMMNEIDLAGWEIGLHGSYHSALNQDLLSIEKREVEDAIGKRIVSTRQHYLHYDVRQTPKNQEQAGFACDSSQGFNRSIGFRAATSFPYVCWNHKEGRPLSILEIPQHIMDGGLFTENALEYNTDLAIQHSIRLMDEVESVGGCLTLSWHPHNIVHEKWWDVYKTILEEAHHRDAWGSSAGEVYNYWTKRQKMILDTFTIKSKK
ncbi:MAG TPA: polysaccharide deacetylase family protein [Bacteroidota bacterium]|nr:polysaccharide deacetylase family protein [Bacteroidota bacterium]